MVCPLSELKEHTHTSACYTEQTALVCGQEETENPHTHGDDCYTEEKTLTCVQEETEGEHTHTDECYTINNVLTCGLEETPDAHVHSDDCYETVQTLTCIKPEVKLHTHTSSCFDANGVLTCTEIEVLEHVHGDECFRTKEQTTLVCGLKEHTHNEDCYVKETEAATEAATEPAEETAAPTEAATEPVKETAAPTEPVTEPVEETAAPTEPATEPMEETAAPTEAATEPVEETAAPTEAATEPVEETTVPTEPAEEAAEETGETIETTVQQVLSTAVMAVDTAASSNITYSVDTIDGVLTLTISGTGAMTDYEMEYYYEPGLGGWYECNSPWAYMSSCQRIVIGEGITRIGSYAFYYDRGVTEVVIPSTVTSIGNNAFQYCSSLGSPTLPEGLTTIGDNAFWGCSGVTSISIPDSVTSVSTTAFNTLNEVSLGSGISQWTNSAITVFGNCKISSATFREGVTAIPDSFFESSAYLNTLELPSTLKSIGATAFYGTNLTEVTLPEGLESIGDFAFYNTGLTSLTIPASVTSFGNRVFASCQSLTEVVLSDGLSTLNGGMFNGTPLTTITVPGSVKTIPSFTLSCSTLQTIILSEGVERLEPNAIASSALTSLTIPSSIKTVGRYAVNASSLSSITLSEGITTIEDYAFYNVSALTEITIPASVTSVTALAFDSSAMTGFYVAEGSESYTSVDGVLYSKDMTSIVAVPDVTTGEFVLPATVTDIGAGAFKDSGVTSVVFQEGYITVASAAFEGTPLSSISGGDYYVDSNGIMYLVSNGTAYVAYQPDATATPLTEIPAKDDPTKTYPVSFDETISVVASGRDGNISWTITETAGVYTLTLTGEGAMKDYEKGSTPWLSAGYSCDKIIICDGITNIGAFACSSRDTTVVEIPDSVTSIGFRAFWSARSLTTVEIPDSVTSIGGSAFLYCTSLTEVEIPDTVTSIGELAFDHTAITEITVPANAEFEFNICTQETLQNFNISEGDTRYKSIDGIVYTADGTTLLYCPGNRTGTQEIPAGVTTVAAEAFLGLASGAEVQLPVGVSKIEDAAFQGAGITTLPLAEGHVELGSGVFANCSNLPSAVSGSVSGDYYVDSAGVMYFIYDGMAFAIYTPSEDVTLPDSIPTEKGYGTYPVVGTRIDGGVDGNIIWMICEKNGVQTLYILGSGEMNDYYDPDGSTAPWYAYSRESIDSIWIGDGITSIGPYAFAYSFGLTDVRIPDSVTAIKSEAFYSCYSLQTVDLPDNMTYLGSAAFGMCWSLTSIELPDTLTYLGAAFNGCSSLTSIVIPDGITKIPGNCFRSCSSLSSVVLPENLESIGSYAFSFCNNLQTITLPEGLTSIGGYAFQYSGLIEIVIPDSVTAIGEYAFRNCSDLKTVVIPDGIRTIPDYCFQNCTSLETVWTPEGYWTMTSKAFSGCTNAADLDTAAAGQYYTDSNGSVYHVVSGRAFFIYSPLSVAKVAESIPSEDGTGTIPVLTGTLVTTGTINGADYLIVEENGERTMYISGTGNISKFYTLSSTYKNTVDKIVIEEGITGITGASSYSTGCFYNFTDLDEVVLPNGFSYIGNYALYRGTSLDTVTYQGDSLQIAYRALPSTSFDGLEFEQSMVYLSISDGALSSLPVGQYYIDTYGAMYLMLDGEAYLLRKPSGMSNYIMPDQIIDTERDAVYPTHEVIAYAKSWVLTGECCDYTAVVFGSGGMSSSYASKVKHGVVLDGVTSIGTSAFEGCTNMTDVVIPDSVTEIGYEAFYNCSSLAEVTIPDSVTEIGSSAFAGCTGLTEVTIPDSVTSISNGAFRDCTSLTEVIIPDSVTEIGAYAFRDCTGLTEVTFSQGYIQLGNGVFEGCTGLEELSGIGGSCYVDGNGVIYCVVDGTAYVAYCPEGVTPLTEIPLEDEINYGYPVSGLTVIASGGDDNRDGSGGCSWILVNEDGVNTLYTYGSGTLMSSGWDSYGDIIDKIVIDDDFTAIYSYAFDSCTGVSEVVFPDGYFKMYTQVFPTDSVYNIPLGSYYKSGDGVVYLVIDDEAYVVFQPEGTTIPEQIPTESGAMGYTVMPGKVIDSDYYTSTTSGYYNIPPMWYVVELPNGEQKLIIIGEKGIKNQTKASAYDWYGYQNTIDYLKICSGVTQIGNYSFQGFTDLKEADIATSVTTIGTYAFDGCTSMTTVTGTTAVNSIGDYAFRNCKVLESIEVKHLGTGVGIFQNCYNLKTVTSHAVSNYVYAYTFQNCYSLETVPNMLDNCNINDYAFQNCRSLKSLSYTVDYVGQYAFYGCTSLEEINFSTTYSVYLYGSAFYNCDSLTEVNLPKSIGTFYQNAFRSCDNLENINVDAANTTYSSVDGIVYTNSGTTLFLCPEGKTGTVTIPEGVTIIYQYGCYDCDKVTEFVLPDTVTSIGSYAFYSCDSLASVDFGDSLKSIGDKAFEDCVALTELELPNTLTSISGNAFRNCDGLTTLDMPDSVTSLGSNAFDDCDGLTEIHFSDGLTNIGQYVLYSCDKLETVEVGASTTSISNYAFGGCSALKNIILNAKALNSCNASAFRSGYYGSYCRKLETLTVGENVDVLYPAIFTAMKTSAGKYPEVSFAGENYFKVSSNFFSTSTLDRPLRALVANGSYYVDAYGALYRLKDDVAMLVYVPAGVESYTVPAQIPAETGDGSYAVGVATDALREAVDLTAIVFEDPAAVRELQDMAMANCPTLLSVNGKTTVEEALALFTNADQGVLILENTGLTGGNREAVTEGIRIATEDGVTLGIVTQANTSDPFKGTFTYYTGTSAKTTLTLTNVLGQEGYTVRVYIHFSSANGSMNYKVGTHSVTSLGNTAAGLQGRPYNVTVGASTAENLYYIDLPDLVADDTLSFDFTTYFPSPTSGDSTATIWGVIRTDDGKAVDSDSEEVCHEVKWTTVAEAFQVTKAATGTPTMYGDGTEGGDVTVHGLSYQIKLNNPGKTPSGKGEDFMTSVDYCEVLTLPEGMHWNEKYLTGTAPCSLTGATYSSFAAAIDGQTLTLTWTSRNTSTAKEMPAQTLKLTFNDDAIVTDEIPETGKVFTLQNDVSTQQHFTYSEDKTVKAPTVYTDVTATKGTLTLDKRESGSYYLGAPLTYTIELENLGTAQLDGVKKIEDPLDDYLYITGAGMDTMFAADTEKALTIVINNASIYKPLTTTTATNTYGNQVALSIQYTGLNTYYHGCEPTEADDENLLARDVAVVTIGWNADGQLQVTATKEGAVLGTALVGNGGIQAALERVGYFVTPKAEYQLTWDYGTTGYTLWSGQERKYVVPATIKNSFMLISWDYPIGNIGTFKLPANEVTVTYGDDATKTDETTEHNLTRDYLLYNTLTVNGSSIVEGDLVELGRVVDYHVQYTVNNAGSVVKDLPLVTHMQGSQILMVPVSGNGHLSTAENPLNTMTCDGVEYYMLDTPGTYENVVIDGFVADSVTVTAYGTNCLDTLIHWYMGGSSTGNTIDMKVLASPVGEVSGQLSFPMYIESWLGDHHTHRLWVSHGVYGSFLLFDKDIVTERGTTPDADTLKKYSVVHEGDTVTYRLELEGLLSDASAEMGINLVVPASVIYDTLPKSVDGARWTKDNVSISYVYDTEKVSIVSPDAWHLEDIQPGKTMEDDADQQYIVWDEPFSITFNRESTMYIYVTLVYPEHEAWGSYGKAYGAEQLRNAFTVSSDQENVYHTLGVESEAQLVKGVVSTGVYKDGTYYPSDDWNSRRYYVNNDRLPRVVEYYVTLYNDGDARVYLNEIQDKLPQGFTFCKVAPGKTNLTTITDDGGHAVKYITNATVTASSSGQYVRFSAAGGGGLHYDANYGRYYLMPGEALVFSYYCYTNQAEDTLQSSDNTVAMEYYDYNTSGVEMGGSTITGGSLYNTQKNDGTCSFLDTTAANKIYGFSGGTADSDWLASTVRVVRGTIVPGISKEVIRRTDAYGQQKPELDYADDTDLITWGVTVSNSGTMPIQDYTVTDVMQYAYDFTGSATYTIYYGDQNLKVSHDLLTFADGKVTCNTTALGEVEVTWKRAADGENAVLAIHFKDSQAAIPERGSAVLEITTDSKTIHRSTVYTNNAYLTPNAQTWDEGDVTQGTVVEYDGQPSVQSGAQIAISSGFVTTSSKRVEQIDDASNYAESKSSAQAIVLPNTDGQVTQVRYTLTVKTTDLLMDRLVLIDNLPEQGDHNTFVDSDLRYSDFKISLTDAPDFKVILTDENGTVTELDETQYDLDFSDKTSFSTESTYGTNDWRGEKSADWYDTPTADTRSFRITISYAKDEEGTETGVLIPQYSSVAVSFNAEIDGDYLPGDIAWNSFGYCYRVYSTIAAELEAAPQKVGVKIPSAPSLVKKVLSPTSEPYEVEKDETFSYVIYEDTGVDLTGLTNEEVAAALAEAGVKYTIADLTVKQGTSQSDALMLKDQVVYTGYDAQTETWTKDETQTWKWVDGQDYTIYELPIVNSREYAFGMLGTNSSNGYVYRHDWSRKVTVTSMNVRRVWNIEVLKIEDSANETVLAEGWFGLYSPKAEQAMQDADIPEDLKEVTIPRELEHGGQTYYLTSIGATDEKGKLLWSDLNELTYLVRELQAPPGYNLNEEVFLLERPTDVSFNTVNLIVRNTCGFTMPESGGIGTDRFLTAGAVIMLISACAYVLTAARKRRRSR